MEPGEGAYVSDTRGGASLQVRVVPRAGRSQIAGVRGGALLIRIAAAPVDGAANDAVVDLLARTLAVPRRSISIASGERSRDKRLVIEGVTADVVRARLQEVAEIAETISRRDR